MFHFLLAVMHLSRTSLAIWYCAAKTEFCYLVVMSEMKQSLYLWSKWYYFCGINFVSAAL
jgi:hypothetical protein